MKYLIYDAEIIKFIPQRNTPNDPQFEYCQGWHDHAGMGIAVVGFASPEKLWHWSINEDFPNFGCLQSEIGLAQRKGAAIIGFNSRSFDDRLLQAHSINVTTDYDILEEVRIAAGFAADYRSVPRGYSYKLDSIAKANGMAKSGSGEMAPVLWQRGERQAVIEYCLMDCRITRTILELGLAGKLVDPNTGKKLKLAQLPPATPS